MEKRGFSGLSLKSSNYKMRRIGALAAFFCGVIIWLFVNPASYDSSFVSVENTGAESGVNGAEAIIASDGEKLAKDVLEKLEVKGRAPKTGYKREEFYSGWPDVDGCSLRQKIIRREFGDSAVLDGCNVVAGEYDEPYTGEHRIYNRKDEISKIQIDHVVALSDAWQKGAQYLEKTVRYNIATDPLNLLAVDGSANQQKSDGDAATWLPSNKQFRCQYVARQISVKYKYGLWVTDAEKQAMTNVLSNCPKEPSVGI